MIRDSGQTNSPDTLCHEANEACDQEKTLSRASRAVAKSCSTHRHESSHSRREVRSRAAASIPRELFSRLIRAANLRVCANHSLPRTRQTVSA